MDFAMQKVRVFVTLIHFHTGLTFEVARACSLWDSTSNVGSYLCLLILDKRGSEWQSQTH